MVVILLLSLWPTSLDELAVCKSDTESSVEHCKSEIERLGQLNHLSSKLPTLAPARDVGGINSLVHSASPIFPRAEFPFRVGGSKSLYQRSIVRGLDVANTPSLSLDPYPGIDGSTRWKASSAFPP